MSSFQGVGIDVNRVFFISGGWSRGVPLYTEVSLFQGVGIDVYRVFCFFFSFQGVGIEEFHCIQNVFHFRVLE